MFEHQSEAAVKTWRSNDSWQRVQSLFARALELPPDTVEEFLKNECGDDADTRDEVLSLLTHDCGEEPLRHVFGAAALTLFQEDSLIGERVGAYQITAAIGHGGMGTVYLAVRADDEYRKQVAIKVVKLGMDTKAMLERFRQERQILANLDHPNIARMLDGGSTAKGRPYLVMEYVDGRPVDEYCRENKLTLAHRCRLFLQVCEAVACAHRNLVVHRDLKPSNILVTREGTPKLLDFGVAKLLNPEQVPDASLTRIGLRPLTPDYASPEQFQGLPSTTAADVYSLGAVFYELLTGIRPHQLPRDRPGEWMRIVCEVDVKPAEEVDPALPADLANIVSMAMRKEPQRRYTSVEQFAQDIEHFIAGRPVIARGDAIGYRTGKFVRRHRVWLAAGVLAGVSLIAGTVVSVIYARDARAAQGLAEREKKVSESAQRTAETQRALAEDRLLQANAARALSEQEHRTAETQRWLAVREAERAKQEQQRSDRRLTQLLDLANRSLFDVHDVIANLPGGTAARQQIVQTTLDYLEKLSKDADGDDPLRETLANAYFRIGSVQGSTSAASLGDLPGALKSFRKGEQWLQPLMSKRPVSRSVLELSLDIAGATGTALAESGQAAAGVKVLKAHLADADTLSRLNPSDARRANFEEKISSALKGLDQQESMLHAQKAVEYFTALAAQKSPSSQVRWGLSTAHSIVASMYAQQSDYVNALKHFRESLQIRERLVAEEPQELQYRRSLMLSYGQVSDSLSRPQSGASYDPRLAYEYLLKAAEIARGTSKADPKDKLAKYDHAAVEFRLASASGSPASGAEKVAGFELSIRLFHELSANDPKAIRNQVQLSLAYQRLGKLQRELQHPAEALAAFRQGLATTERVLAIEPKDTRVIEHSLSDEEGIAELLAASGEASEARRHEEHARERARVSPVPPGRIRNQMLAESYRSSAQVERLLGDWSKAHTYAEQSAGYWRELASSADGSGYGGDLKSVEALLAECRQHLP